MTDNDLKAVRFTYAMTAPSDSFNTDKVPVMIAENVSLGVLSLPAAVAALGLAP